MPDLTQLSFAQAAAALAAGTASSRSLADALFARIDAVEPRVKAYLSLDRTAVLADSEAADARRAAGQARGPYDGVPLAIKDNLNVTGQPCTCASKILAGYTAGYDATVIAKLRAAGVIPCGRTNLDEFAMGSSTENSGYGPTANPWDLERVPGGSSGGSAAAVAAGEAFAALGSDTGGSIRQPASFCGVVGLKPTYGLVSRYGLVAFASSLDQIGPITRTVEDAAILLDLIAGPDPQDSTTLPEQAGGCAAALADAAASVRGLRIGLPREYFETEGLDPEVRRAVEAAGKELEKLGATLVPVSVPTQKYGVGTYYIIATAEASANLARFDGIRYGFRDAAAQDLMQTYRLSRAHGFGPEVKRRILLGTYVLSSGYYDAYYLRAQKVRTLIRNDFTRVFGECDLILAPTAPTPAFKRGEKAADPLAMYLADIYTITVNLAGICAISLPCGFSAGGLPIGMQLMGPALGEKRLLQAAQAYEQTANLANRIAPLGV